MSVQAHDRSALEDSKALAHDMSSSQVGSVTGSSACGSFCEGSNDQSKSDQSESDQSESHTSSLMRCRCYWSRGSCSYRRRRRKLKELSRSQNHGSEMSCSKSQAQSHHHQKYQKSGQHRRPREHRNQSSESLSLFQNLASQPRVGHNSQDQEVARVTSMQDQNHHRLHPSQLKQPWLMRLRVQWRKVSSVFQFIYSRKQFEFILGSKRSR